MTLYLSATSISDYLDCYKRYWYRTHKKEAAVVNEYVTRGTAVHEAIEKNDEIEGAREYIRNYYTYQAPLFANVKGDGLTPAIDKMLQNYYEKINPKLGDYTSDLIEHRFDLLWSDEVHMVGKMDRVTFADPIPAIYDWKTGTSAPNFYVTQEAQFYIYWWAFKEIWDDLSEPSVFYGHLYSGRLYKVDILPEVWYNIKSLINRMIDDVLESQSDYDNYPRVPGYQCDRCFYKGICWASLEKEE